MIPAIVCTVFSAQLIYYVPCFPHNLCTMYHNNHLSSVIISLVWHCKNTATINYSRRSPFRIYRKYNGSKSIGSCRGSTEIGIYLEL